MSPPGSPLPRGRRPGPSSVSPEPPPSDRGAAAMPPEDLLTAAERSAPSEPGPCDVIARFATAAGALGFAEQVMQAAQLDSADCYQAGDGASWWVAARLTLGAAREMADLGGGRLYVRSGDGVVQDLVVQDRGWGDDPPPGPGVELPELAGTGLLDLVRVAGLHPVPDRPLPAACVLAPGYLVPGIVDRAVDLGLRVTYRLATLDPLFEAAPPRASYGVWLSTGPRQEALPGGLLSALRDDPFCLVCRPAGEALLIGHGTASPLSDRSLTRLVGAAGGGTWLLAAPPDGCARVTWEGEPMDAVALVRRGPAHALTGLDASQPYAEPAGRPSLPEPRPLTVVPGGTRAAAVDAVLLNDADLDCLPLLLAGDPLADIAFLIRGAGRHLLAAPGGLLTDLPVGEPLTCVGPGSLYLPTGWRLDPPVGPAARAVLFEPDAETAQVVLRDARLGYRLDAAQPLWRLWAGPVPDLDPQLPRSALADLEQAAREIGEPAPVPERPRSLLSRLRGPRPAEPAGAAEWRRQAHQAELARDYVAAAQLYARHSEPLRAARMWERDAEEKS
jgi:hypothetical protein